MNTVAAILLAIGVSFLISFLLGFVVIPFLRKLHFGQTILEIGPAWHKSKQGTPTMGGFMFIISTVVSFAAVIWAIVCSAAICSRAARLFRNRLK